MWAALLERLKKAARDANTTLQLTKNFGFVLDTARSRAKHDGSPWVLEHHLLEALLLAPSSATFEALRYLGIHHETLRARLLQSHSAAGAPSEFPVSG
jgi:hypothetical protein